MLPCIEEDWAIWLRWAEAFKVGATDISTHPTLPEDRPRRQELQAALAPFMRVDRNSRPLYRPEFRSGDWNQTDLEVRWTKASI